jgi:hypothetical protein
MAPTGTLVRRVRLASIAVATAGVLTGPVIAEDLNPQPEPPSSNKMLQSPGTSFRLNPQPEPPGSSRTHRPLDWLGLNPQPEPPSKRTFRPQDWQGLNPQPEPP